LQEIVPALSCINCFQKISLGIFLQQNKRDDARLFFKLESSLLFCADANTNSQIQNSQQPMQLQKQNSSLTKTTLLSPT
jgi:hypothetical protein